MSYNLVNPTTGDLTQVAGGINTAIIPSNASASNKLVTKSDAVTRHDYNITGTTDAIADTQALVNHILTLGVGTYVGEFKRTGITFGSYRLTYLIDGNYSKSVSGLVTYSINASTDATYQVSYVEDIEHGTPPEWKIVKLAADSTIYECSGFILNSVAGEISGYGRATVTLKDGRAEIKFSVRIHTNDGPATFNWGLNRDLLHTLLPNLPVITPIGNNSNLQYFAGTGDVLVDLMGYGAMASSSNQFWVPARMYQIDGSTGTWGTDRFPINSYITGTVYGVYTV